jgi:hypothetical protein
MVKRLTTSQEISQKPIHNKEVGDKTLLDLLTALTNHSRNRGLFRRRLNVVTLTFIKVILSRKHHYLIHYKLNREEILLYQCESMNSNNLEKAENIDYTIS